MLYPPATHLSICCRRFSDLHSRPTEWLWDRWLPLGKLAILEGDPGLGKSMLALDLCARLTSGRPWPDGSAARTPCQVVVITAEDDVEDTVRPRLLALGADLDRVHSFEGVESKNGQDPFRFPTHALALADVLRETQAKLVVLDPFVALLDRSVASHHDQGMRAALRMLSALAKEAGCAMLLLRHLNKVEQQRALYRGSGSIGFSAAVRCAWLLAADPKHPDRRVLGQLKNNLRTPASSLSLEITEGPAKEPKLSWLGTSSYGCDQLLERKRGRGRPASRRERAAENLKVFLEEAPRRSDEVQDFAKEERISEPMLKRIKPKLGIRSVRAPDGDRRSTFWLLPGQLPENASEEMLTLVETPEAEQAAIREEFQADLVELARKTGQAIPPWVCP